MHLQCLLPFLYWLITIFTIFSVIYRTQWCNLRIIQIYANFFKIIQIISMDSRYQINICRSVHKYHQIVHKLFTNFRKNTNIHVGWAYTIHTTCIPLELHTGVDAGVDRPTTDVRACILDDRDLERWSTSMWWGPAARLARPTDGAPRPCDSWSGGHKIACRSGGHKIACRSGLNQPTDL